LWGENRKNVKRLEEGVNQSCGRKNMTAGNSEKLGAEGGLCVDVQVRQEPNTASRDQGEGFGTEGDQAKLRGEAGDEVKTSFDLFGPTAVKPWAS